MYVMCIIMYKSIEIKFIIIKIYDTSNNLYLKKF